MHEIIAGFIAAIGAAKMPAVLVCFSDGRPCATYPADFIEELKTDKIVRDICDAETGEIIFTRGA